MNNKEMEHRPVRQSEDIVSGIVPYESLTLRNNFIFSKVMTYYPDNCRDLLVRIFPYLPIGKVEVIPESSEQATPDSKGVRFDVYATDGSYLFDLEMQATEEKDLPRRSRYYNCVMDIDQVYRGHDYAGIKPVYIIFICTFALPYGSRHRYTFRRSCVEDPEIAMGDGTEIVLLSTKGAADDVDEPMRRFLDYVEGKPGAEDGDDFTRQLHQSVKLTRMNKEWKREYMNMEIMIKHREEAAVAEAAPKIREAAVAEEAKRSAALLLELGKLTDSEITRATGITAEELQNLRKDGGAKPE